MKRIKTAAAPAALLISLVVAGGHPATTEASTLPAAQPPLDLVAMMSEPTTPPVTLPEPELVGAEGYAVAGGNCVNEPGINNPRDGTNPSGWPITSEMPWVGATAVFTWNHVGVVTGKWKNGDIEVRHQNYWGGNVHRFPPSAFRGFR
jgi:hypothetical protein